MFLDDIKGLITTETNKYTSSMPDDINNCICIYATGGNSPTMDLSGNLLHRSPFFMIKIRDESYLNGHNRSEAILLLLSNKLFTVNTTKYTIYAKSDILSLGKDEKNRSEFSINFEVVIVA